MYVNVYIACPASMYVHAHAVCTHASVSPPWCTTYISMVCVLVLVLAHSQVCFVLCVHIPERVRGGGKERERGGGGSKGEYSKILK
jgi:hypothetical protein